MGTLFQRRHLGATVLIASLAVGGYTLFGLESVDTATAQGTPDQAAIDPVAYPVGEPQPEVLGAIESAEAEGQGQQLNNMPGFTGDAEVDLPTIDPAVIVIEDLSAYDLDWDIKDLRVKYVAATDELIIGLNSVGIVGDPNDVTIALDLNNDGTFDLEVPNPPISPSAASPDLVFSIADFSQLSGNDDSLSFGINAVTASDTVATAIPVKLDAKIGSFVFADTNADGIQDPDEPGIEGITVQLLDENATTVAETTTGAAGEYEISIAPGTYAVEFFPRPGDVFSPRHAGGNRSLDSNADPTTGQTSFTFIGPGEENLTLDAGLS